MWQSEKEQLLLEKSEAEEVLQQEEAKSSHLLVCCASKAHECFACTVISYQHYCSFSLHRLYKKLSVLTPMLANRSYQSSLVKSQCSGSMRDL